MATILILDHEAIYRNLCKEMLTREKHTVILLSSGEKLSAVFEEEQPDLMVIDPKLLSEDGFAIIDKVSKEIPVIVFTGRLSLEIEKKAFEAGAAEVLSKTSEMDILRVRIKKILEHPERPAGIPLLSPNHEKILIVDDEEGIRCLLKIFLDRRGFCSLTAGSGEEALEIVRKEHPRMILLDVMMPGMDGILTLKKIREMDPQAGVVMATGLQDEGLIREAAELGAYASVFKPFDMKYLELVVLTRLTMS